MKKRFALAVIATAAMAFSLENGDGAVVLTTCTVLFL
jgi:hypothetical protein